MSDTTRRSVLRRVGAITVGIATAARTSTTATTANEDPTEIWWQMNTTSVPRSPTITYQHHLSSAIRRIVSYSHDHPNLHDFRVGATFTVDHETRNGNEDDGNTPEPPAGAESQTIYILNESPSNLVVQRNPTEIAVMPQPPDVATDNILGTIGEITLVLGLAARLLRLSALSSVVGPLGLAAGMVGLSTDILSHNTDRRRGMYRIHANTHPYHDTQGGHHARFTVRQSGPGSLLVASQTRHVTNAWRLRFAEDSLKSVNPISDAHTLTERQDIPPQIRREQL